MENQALVQVVKTGDSLFGKAFTFLKEVGEHVLVEIETEGGKIERVFHKDHVQVIQNNVPSHATTEQVEASAIVLETAPAPFVSAPADKVAESTPPGGETAPEDQPAP